MIYLGTLGRMIGIKCPASQNVEHEERYTFQTTLEGRRKAQVRPAGRRTWSLQTSDATTPEQAATLMQFADGAWGPGPFVFVSADAAVTNLLPPSGRVFAGFVDAGPMQLEGGGWAPFSSSLASGASGTIQFTSFDPPVIPGKEVTASAWVLGVGASVMVQFFSATGSLISSISSPAEPVSGLARRLHVTAEAPSNSATARVTARNAVSAALPAITWSDRVLPYGDGQGCPKAVVHSVSRDQVLAVLGHTYSNLSFMVTEVG